MSLARAGEPADGPVSAANVSYLFRTYADVQDIEGVLKRHAVTANLRARFDTGLTPGAVGIGLNASVFVGTDIGSSDNAGNMAHVNRDWTRASSRAWAYLGEYGVRLKAGDLSLRYGLQQLSNPFLESRDNRGLPPTFRGLSGQMALDKAWWLEAGYVDSVIPRGMVARRPLATTYGNTPVRRLDFAGLAYEGTDGRTASIYAARAQDTWAQYFLSGGMSFGDANAASVQASASTYLTRSIGSALQGAIDTTAYSGTVSPSWGPVSIGVGYQRIAGAQFFDYLAESWGILLANAYGADYNAPHERSVVYSLSFDGKALGWRGWKSTIWRGRGWGADASATAALYADPATSLHALYWKNGQPMHGSHREVGLTLAYANPSSAASTQRWKLIAVRHWSTRHYSEDPFYEVRLTLDHEF